jgi:hypothetical protein
LAKPDDSARVEARKVLVTLRDALDQPPLLRRHQLALDVVLDLLAEQDIAKRVAARDRLDAMLAELDGEPGPNRDPNPPLITRPHDWPHDQ